MISISELGFELGLRGALPWPESDALSCFFLPKSPPSPFITAADGLVGIELSGEELLEGGGFDGCWLCALVWASPGCPLGVADNVMVT